MNQIERWFTAAWPMASPFFYFVLGGVFTRWILIPRFCPECVRRREWTARMLRESHRKKENIDGSDQ